MNAQTISQDVDGYSPIIIPTSSIALDIPNGVANFSFYNRYDINKQSKQNSKFGNNITVGGEVTGKVKDGLGTLFSGGDATSTGAITLMGGFHWNSIHKKNGASFNKKLNEAKRRMDDEISLRQKINTLLSKLHDVNIIDDDYKIILSPYYKDGTAKNEDVIDASILKKTFLAYDKLSDYHKQIENTKNTIKNRVDTLKKFYGLLITLSRSSLENYADNADSVIAAYKNLDKYHKITIQIENINSQDSLSKVLNKTLEVLKKESLLEKKLKNVDSKKYAETYLDIRNTYLLLRNHLIFCNKNKPNKYNHARLLNKKQYAKNGLVYIRASGNGTTFKYDYGQDSLTIKSRFQNRNFLGYRVELGYTLQIKNYNFLGASIATNYTNNLSGLSSSTYNLKTLDTTISTGNFTSSQDITAISGSYDTFYRYDFNFDYAYLIKLKPNKSTSHLYLNINPYLRHYIYDVNTSNLNNNTILGLGLHMYNATDNKIMGGVFVQTNDVFGNMADEKSTFGKRISIGIIAKFGFKGFEPKE
ncbi:MAG: hypothetical protein R2800_09590 [Flavipsychrobacter sp.]